MSETEKLNPTFRYLAKTENEAALDILFAGLKCSDKKTRSQSLRAILDRRSSAAHVKIFQRLDKFDEDARDIIKERSDRLVPAATAALADNDDGRFVAACKSIVSYNLYEAVAPLVAVLPEVSESRAEVVAAAILKLTEAFYAELSGATRDASQKGQEAVRIKMTAALEDAVRKFYRHQRLEVIEAFLTISKQKNLTLRQMLMRSEEASHQPILDVLTQSSSGGVLRLLLSFLEDAQMPGCVAGLFSTRSDRKFVENFLRVVSPRPSRNVCETIRRFKSFDWAEPGHEVLQSLDDLEQAIAVRLVTGSGMGRAEALELVGYMLLEGKPGGRKAAAAALRSFEGHAAAALTIKGLQDSEPEVLAPLIEQLRPRKVAGAYGILIRMVDNPSPVVHEALRKAMPEFTFRQFLTNFDSMDEDLQPIAGHIVRKIDDGVSEKILEEFSGLSPVRRRKAILAAGAMGMVPELEQEIVKLLSDEDHMVRVEVAKVLADSKSAPTWEALQDALLDKSFAVKEAVEQSLDRISKSLVVDAEEETEENAEPEEVTRV